MARCEHCGTGILFGGVRDGDARYCNAQCHHNGQLAGLADHLPEAVVSQFVHGVHDGECPKCHGPGPIDVHVSHTVWSAVVLTSWRSRPELCCHGCGVKAKLGGILFSAALGWWGFPWGLVFTPVQILRNLLGLLAWPDPTRPSPKLERLVKVHLASKLMEQHQGQGVPA